MESRNNKWEQLCLSTSHLLLPKTNKFSIQNVNYSNNNCNHINSKIKESNIYKQRKIRTNSEDSRKHESACNKSKDLYIISPTNINQTEISNHIFSSFSGKQKKSHDLETIEEIKLKIKNDLRPIKKSIGKRLF